MGWLPKLPVLRVIGGISLWGLGLDLSQDLLEEPLQMLPGLKVGRLAGDDMFYPACRRDMRVLRGRPELHHKGAVAG